MIENVWQRDTERAGLHRGVVQVYLAEIGGQAEKRVDTCSTCQLVENACNRNSLDRANNAKAATEEGIELLGITIMLIGAIEFLLFYWFEKRIKNEKL